MSAKVIWINGPFGGGKTQTAWEIAARCSRCFVLDPEEIGYALRRLAPQEVWLSDFQDMPLWRDVVRRHIEEVANGFEGVLVVPMTLVRTDYFDEIVGGLRRAGIDLQHVALMAPRETVLKRLRKRGDGENSWPAQQLDRCLSALADERFSEHLNTNQRSVVDVAEAIAQSCGVPLLPRLSVLRQQIQQCQVWFRHMRWLRRL